jgi:beta-lactamase regulating signal transducer with metallopeptidase domain
MPLLFLQQWIPGEALHALGWTFLHSLWQGLLAAMLAAIIMMGTRKSTARLRYQLLCVVMTCFVVATFITFCYYWQLPVAAADVSLAGNTPIVTNTIGVSNTIIAGEDTGFMEKLSAWFDANINVVVIIWALFFFMNCLKLFTGLASVNRLRQYRTKKAPAVWEDKLPKLVASLGIKQKVVLLQSALVKVPVAIGILRPVVLVPIGLLMHLPAEQAETILLHELAHIKRKDYLVNLLQRIAEAIFFFNPALLWISSLIRIEREACCDDVVLAHTSQRRDYLEALVAFQEYTAPLPSYALGISNKKNLLLQRIKRIITLENRKAGWVERIVLLSGVLFLMAFTVIKQKADVKEDNNSESVNNAADYTGNQVQPSSVLQPQALPGVTFAGIEEAPAGIKKTAIPVEPARQLRLSSDRTRNISLSNLVYRDTPRVKVQPVIIQPISKTTYTIINHSYHKANDGETKETVTAIGPGGVKYFFLEEDGHLEKIKVNGRNIPENDFPKYKDVIQAISHELQAGRKASSKEVDKPVKGAEDQAKKIEEKMKKQIAKMENQAKENEKKMEGRSIKAEENDYREENKTRISDGKGGDGKVRIEEPRTGEDKPRIQKPRTDEEKKLKEKDKGAKPANDGITIQPRFDMQYRNTATFTAINTKGAVIEMKNDIKVEAKEWETEKKWDLQLNDKLFAARSINLFDKTDNKKETKTNTVQANTSANADGNTNGSPVNPRRKPFPGRKIFHKPPTSPDKPGVKEAPKPIRRKIVL